MSSDKRHDEHALVPDMELHFDFFVRHLLGVTPPPWSEGSAKRADRGVLPATA